MPGFHRQMKNSREVLPAMSLQIPAELQFLNPLVVDSMVRIGAPNDGGYVLPPECIRDADGMISMGISNDWSFEEQSRAINPQLQIQGYDHTISSYIFKRKVVSAWLRAVRGKAAWADMHAKAHTARDYGRFWDGRLARHHQQMVGDPARHRGAASVATMFGRTSARRVFLKIDIEGSEYEIIDELLHYADRVTGIAMELHETDTRRATFVEAVRKLQTRFDLVHLHANNYGSVAADGLPVTLEASFVRKAPRAEPVRLRHVLPLAGLDAPNNPALPDYTMQFATA